MAIRVRGGARDTKEPYTVEIDPVSFSHHWAASWNARDVEAVLKHFSEDALFSSPVAQRLGHGNQGVVTGKDALRRYWHEALALNPLLHFEVTNVYAGADAIVIAYRTHDGTTRTEVLVFRARLVVAGYGTLEV